MLKILRRGIRKLIVVTKKLSWQFFFVKFQWYFAKFLFNYYTLYLATKSLYPGSNEISFAQNLQFFFFFFNRTLVTTERKEKRNKKKQAKGRNNLLQDYGSTAIFQILQILSVLQQSPAHEDTSKTDLSHSHPSALERAPLPPRFWSERLSRDRCDSSFCFPSCGGGAIPFPPFVSRPSRGLRAVTRPSALPSFCTFRVAPHCSTPLPLEYVHAERCRENQVTGRGVARLTREIEIIEQSRRLGDIYSHEFERK